MLFQSFAFEQIAVLIKSQIDHPAENVARPLSIVKESLRIGTQRAQQTWDFAVPPTDQNVGITKLPDLVCQFRCLLVLKTIIDCETELVREWFQSEPRAMTVFGVFGREQIT